MKTRWSGIAPWLLLSLVAVSPLEGQDPPEARVPVTGIVLDVQSGSGIPAASIRLVNVEDEGVHREARSDQDGRFHLPHVPAGRYRLEVSALSYLQLLEEIDILGLGPADIRVEIVPEALELDAVVVTTTAGGWLARTGFYERRNHAVGTFLTRAEIQRHTTGPLLSDVFRMMPGARVVRPAGFGEPARVEFRGGCEPPIFVDGNPLMSETTVDEVLESYDVEGMEVYRGVSVPPQFAGRGSCGAIVVWTREPGRGEGSSAILPNLGRALVGLGTILAAALLSL